MSANKICPGCGGQLAADAPAGLCPRCLLQSEVPTITDGPNPTRPVGTLPVPVVGEVFGGYRILRLLGRGGMGEVYEAEHIETGRHLALKVMSHALASEQDRKRFLREGRLAASVNHANVVYIYGSEEIQGVPVIAMELVAGGTLKDKLKSAGPLPIAEAVGAITQLISGLEAAQAAGVLHRDIKPANCFVAMDGTIKVGDFGLSVSTLARGESLLTATGSVLGTPAYASPEQLRGEELDLRSDVYSLGATLYHLLTGRPPFPATDFVKLITEVLDREPEAPQRLRAELPSQLSRVILRCLAKDRKARFQSYRELLEALLPFCAAERTPANPARRFLAGVLDDLLAYGPSLMFLVYWSFDPLERLTHDRTLKTALIWAPFYLWYLLYYSLPEGLWGAALGKNLLGIQVVGPDGQRPGVWRALVRVFIYALPFTLPSWLALIFIPPGKMGALGGDESTFLDWLYLPLLGLLFVTMRARNGYAALHDLGSRTRVIVRPRAQEREPLPAEVLPSGEGPALEPLPVGLPRAFGPYEALGLVWSRPAESLVLAMDPVLKRRIWIHLGAKASLEIGSARRIVSRPTCLRWLANGSLPQGNWEAYEALDGLPFAIAANRANAEGHPWSHLRFWLVDLAEELGATLRESPGKFVATDRLWIDRTGRAVVLDFAWPSLPASLETPRSLTDMASLQGFLATVTAATLRTPESEGQSIDAALCNPSVPRHARGFLGSLLAGGFQKVEYILGNLQSLLGKPARITRSRRTASLLLFPGIFLISAVLLGLMVNFIVIRSQRFLTSQFADGALFRQAVELYSKYQERKAEGEDVAEDLELAGAYLNGNFSFLSTNDTFWAKPEVRASLAPDQVKAIRQVLAAPAATAEKLKEANKVIPRRAAEAARSEQAVPFWVIIGWSIACISLLALVEFLYALIFREQPVLRLLGIAVVDHCGEAASRGRLLARWCLTWFPGVLAAFACGGALAFMLAIWQGFGASASITAEQGHALQFVSLAVALVVGTLWTVAVVFAAVYPHRALQDRLVGTWLTPR